MLQCQDLTKDFECDRGLFSFTYAFPSSGLVGLIGPNGAGKTTLLNLVTGFLRPDSGTMTLDGGQLIGLQPHSLAQLGIRRTFQDLRLVQRLSVSEHLQLASLAAREDPAHYDIGKWLRSAGHIHHREVRELISELRLAHLASSVVGELSYGQQKLVSLACAVTGRSRLIFLDEPVAGVDPLVREAISGYLRRLEGTSKLIVVIEHDLAFVRELCDELVVLDEGRIVASGSTEKVLANPEVLEAFVA